MGKIARKFVAGSKSCSRNLSPTHPWGRGVLTPPLPHHTSLGPLVLRGARPCLYNKDIRGTPWLLARRGEQGCERHSVQRLLARSADHQPHDSLGASSKSCPLALSPAGTQQVCGGGFWGTAP